MNTFKNIAIGDSIYILRGFKNNDNIYESEIINATITNYRRDEDDILYINITYLNDKKAIFSILNEDVVPARAFIPMNLIPDSGDYDEICDVFIDENDALQSVKDQYEFHIKCIQKHIEKLNKREILYKKLLERWEKRF